MLTLTRKMGESIRIGDNIQVVIKEVKGRQVRIGISAPRDIYVCREELYLKIQKANQEANQSINSPVQTQHSSLATLGSLILSKHSSSSPSPSAKTEISTEDEIIIDIPPQMSQKGNTNVSHPPVNKMKLTGEQGPNIKEDQDES